MNPTKSSITSVLAALLIFISINTFATHLRSVDIKIEPDCANPLRFKFTVIGYIDTSSETDFGEYDGSIHFGDGTTKRIDMTFETPRPDLGEDIGIATYVTYHTYSTFGIYSTYYIEGDRSDRIVNILNSGDVDYVTKAVINVNSKYNCNNFPVLSVPPLDRACSKIAFYHTSGAYDIDGDSLSYELTTPLQSESAFAPYISPIEPMFYTNFAAGNETFNGKPTLRIDPVSGLLTWNAPDITGDYNIAFKIIEWRKDSLTNTYVQLSSFVRDMQIVVEPCTNKRPQLIVPNDICVTAGTSITEIIKGTDIEKHSVKIEVFSEILDLKADKSPATYSPRPPVFTSSDPFAQLEFTWATQCLHVRQQPYQVVLKITDNPPDGPKLVTFAVWNIRVLAPAPILQTATPDLVKRFANLEWESYYCANASSIQVWRKVGSAPFTPGNCKNGIPKNLGYFLIATLPPTQTTYTDTNFNQGLAVGAQYCYRIVPYFNSPASTSGKTSQELCVGPIQADAPVITHVSVGKTSLEQGEIRVSWRKPFAINKEQFPEPYEYEIYRAEGLYGEENLTLAGRVSDTTFLDPAVNTHQNVYNYRIILYGQPQNASVIVPIDTSAIASSEWLDATAAINKIELVWRDSVPWSNVADQKPYHLVYRGIDTDDPTKMILHDSVKVSDDGYTYTDLNLEEDLQYSYRILTRGTYGNPNIALQENYSQVVFLYPENNLLPCSPNFTVDITVCKQYIKINNCGETTFSNSLHWNLEGLRQCRKNIKHYTVFAANSSTEEFLPIATVTDTLFIDSGLPTLARCYRVTATDFNGQTSAPSEIICNDNCPYFLLPNVITPINDSYNDTFTSNFEMAEGSEPTEGDIFRCPRFVEHVTLEVINRWGQNVFTFESKNQNDVSINWNGTNNKGEKLASGVYFYLVNVTFKTLDPKQRKKAIKGWIHVLTEE